MGRKRCPRKANAVARPQCDLEGAGTREKHKLGKFLELPNVTEVQEPAGMARTLALVKQDAASLMTAKKGLRSNELGFGSGDLGHATAEIEGERFQLRSPKGKTSKSTNKKPKRRDPFGSPPTARGARSAAEPAALRGPRAATPRAAADCAPVPAASPPDWPAR